jgi:hypothetical protein
MSISDFTQEELDDLAIEMLTTMRTMLKEIVEITKMLPRLEELQSEYRRHYHNYRVMFGELDEH